MTDPSSTSVVLITGCSTGVGRGTARRFAARGCRVYASMRRPLSPEGESLREEAARHAWRLTTPRLDVTDPGSVDAAISALLDETGGRLDILVNNAGYLLTGALEETGCDDLRALFETLVLGVHRVTRGVLPAMRAHRSGCIVFVSSVAARTTVPMLGAYAAAKSALEAMAEAWRYELIPFGIRVVIVEPGPFDTALHRNEVRPAEAALPGSPYGELTRRFDERSRRVPRWPVERVVRTIETAATARRPGLRWPVGPLSVVGGRLRPAMPDWLLERLVRRILRLRGPLR